jgi:predicted regulator of Ras-like GTPase activity (Roadblock/LC7/MglB family)
MVEILSPRLGEHDRNELVRCILEELQEIPGIKYSLVVSTEGFPIFSTSRSLTLEEDGELKVSAMIAGIETTVSSATQELEEDQVDLMTIQTSSGQILICKLSEEMILVVVASRNVKLGYLLYMTERARQLLVTSLRRSISQT